jgi:penicillin-binding protein 1C
LTSPWRATWYTFRLGRDEPGIALAATAAGDARRLDWFADGAFLGETAVGEILAWHPTRAGRVTVSVVDDFGRADRREVEIGVDKQSIRANPAGG